jgi:hypothetical protein
MLTTSSETERAVTVTGARKRPGAPTALRGNQGNGLKATDPKATDKEPMMTELHSIDSARIALRALVDEYALASDTTDIERFGSLFTPDAEFVMSTPGSAESVTLRGREQVKFGPSGNQMFERTFHAVHNQVVDVDRAHAAGVTYCTARHLLRKADGGLEVILAPILYHDEYEFTSQGWKFSRRELEWTWIERAPAEPPAPWW